MELIKSGINLLKKYFSFLSLQDYLFIFLIFFITLGTIFSGKLFVTGDGTEYIMSTETMFLDRSLEFSDKVLNRHMALKPGSMIDSGYTANKGRNDKQYLTQHPFYYSLFSVPLYGFLYLINAKLAYFSFSITNLFLFIFTAMILIYYFKKVIKIKNYLFLVFSLLFASTAYPYIFWQHPETFIFFNVTFAFFLLYGLKKPLLSAVFLGLAVGQSIVLCFLFINIIYEILVTKKSDFRKVFLASLIFGAVSSFHYILTYVYTGRFFSLAGYSTFSLLAMRDVIYAIFDPSVGLFWFYPVSAISILFMKKNLRSAILITSAFVSLLFFMINNQFYTHQIGLRYLNYLYPIFFFIIDFEKIKKYFTHFALLLLTAFLLTSGMNMNITSTNDSMNPINKNFLAYRIASKVLFPYYKEHPSFFIYHSTLLDNEIKTEDPWTSFKVYASNTGGNIYSGSKWLLQNKWINLMMNPINPGEVEIYLDQECGRTSYILDSKRVSIGSNVIKTKITPRMIGHTDKRDMYIFFSNYAYIDIMVDPVCNIKRINKIVNNDKVVYLNTR